MHMYIILYLSIVASSLGTPKNIGECTQYIFFHMDVQGIERRT